MKKSRQFSAWFAVTLVGLVGLYAWLFKTTVVSPEPVVPHSYMQFLLEYVDGPRILVESGSNGYHSINGELMESLSGYPTIILSDYAAASLHDKIERLRTYAHPGDIVLMPLEWGYYISDDLSWLHLRTSINETNFYYHSLSPISQLRRAFETPWSIVCYQCFNSKANQDDFFGQMDRMNEFIKHNMTKAPYGGAGDAEWQRKSADESHCDDYIFSRFGEAPPKLADDFRDAMKMLGALQRDKGVRVIVVPPVVVGNDCYERGDGILRRLLPQAERVLEANGIAYLADYQRYVFGGDHFLNTHYHIDEAARNTYTPLLLGDLVDAKLIEPKDRSGPPLTERLPSLIDKMRYDLFAKQMPKWNGKAVRIIDGKHQGIFFLSDGWSDEEDWGIWATGEEAEIVCSPAADRMIVGISINARYFNGSQETAVYINDQLVGRHDFSEEPNFLFGKPLWEWTGDNPVVRLRFESRDLKSPQELGAGKDGRTLKFGIHSLELIQE